MYASRTTPAQIPKRSSPSTPQKCSQPMPAEKLVQPKAISVKSTPKTQQPTAKDQNTRPLEILSKPQIEPSRPALTITIEEKQYMDHSFLVSLIQMGYTDARTNLELLRRTNGNLPSALEILLRA